MLSSSRPKILVVEDEKSIQESLKMILEDLYWVVAVDTAEAALQLLEKEAYTLALVDINLPGMNGEELLSVIKTSWTATEVVMVTGAKDVDQAVRCMKQGAYDYISKPWKIPELQAVVNRAAEKWALTQENSLLRQSQEAPGEVEILGSSEEVKLLRERIQKVAAHDSTVLIEGECGTGKELVARAIHSMSARRKGRFVAIPCGALPANLIESELFGHEKGAFSSAFTSRVGKFEFASGGTLFLDDVAALPLESQSKLLRVLQEKEVSRLGSNRVIAVDVRILSSSNQDLKELVKNDLFREDLYWRLCGVPIHVTPLRERGNDAVELFEIFVRQICAAHRRYVPRISPAALEAIKNHSFPGNIRELKNLAETMVVLCEDDEIAVSSLPIQLIMRPTEQGVAQTPLKKSVHEFERQLILRTLRSVNHHQIKAAEALGIHRNTLILKMIAYGIPNKKTFKNPGNP